MRDDAGCLDITPLSDELLRQWPLPMPSADADKEQRGHVLVVGGSREMPGAAVLAGTAALRAGAGKLVIGTGASVAHLVALAIPEARVIALPETAAGGVAPGGAHALSGFGAKVDAVLIGPGMQDEPSICELVLTLLPKLGDAKVVLDANAMSVVRKPQKAAEALGPGGKRTGQRDSDQHVEPMAASSQHESGPETQCYVERFTTPPLLTPHAGEMAHLTGMDKDQVLKEPYNAARLAARRWNAVVALKSATTFIATPQGQVWRHDGGNVGLAISGSGDTLAGIIAGLAARGASLEQASAWGVVLHARAGERLAARFGPLGYLAREIVDEVPALMHALRPG